MKKINFSKGFAYFSLFLLGSSFLLQQFVFAATTANVTVMAMPSTVALSPDTMTLNIGATGALVLTATYDDNSTADITAAPAELLNWASSNEAVATVAGGVVTAVGSGQTTITATYGEDDTATSLITVNNPASGGGGSGSSIEAVVPAPEYSFLTIEPKDVDMKIGAKQQFLAKAHYTDDSMVDVADDVVWEVGDETVINVVDGLVTALQPGKTTISAIYQGKFDIATVVVIAPVNEENVDQNLQDENPEEQVGEPEDGINDQGNQNDPQGDGQNNQVNGGNAEAGNGNPNSGGNGGQAQLIEDLKFDQQLDKYLAEVLYLDETPPADAVSRQEALQAVLDTFKLRIEKKDLFDRAYADLADALSVFANYTSYQDFLDWYDQSVDQRDNKLRQIYPDVFLDSKHYKDVLDATILNVVNGYFQEKESPFKPERIISRIEALKVILNGADLIKWKYYPELVASLGGVDGVKLQSTVFHDVSGQNQYMWWYPRYVNRACDLKIFDCPKDGLFNPDLAITRGELKAWMEAAANVSKDTALLDSLPKEQVYQTNFTDRYEGSFTRVSDDDEDIFTNGIFTDPNDSKALDKLVQLGVRITNFEENQLVGDSQPIIKGFAPHGSTVEIILSNEIGHEKVLGQTLADENSIFAFETPQPIRDGSYKLIARALIAEKKIVLESKPVRIRISLLLQVDPPKVKKIAAKTISDYDILKNVRVYISDRKPVVTGVTGYGNKVIVTWRSLIMTSSLVSDNATGNFAVTTPRELEYGDHQVFVQAVRQSDGALSKAVKLYFRINAQFDSTQMAYNAVGSFINFVQAKIVVFIALMVLAGLGIGGYFWSRRV